MDFLSIRRITEYLSALIIYLYSLSLRIGIQYRYIWNCIPTRLLRQINEEVVESFSKLKTYLLFKWKNMQIKYSLGIFYTEKTKSKEITSYKCMLGNKVPVFHLKVIYTNIFEIKNKFMKTVYSNCFSEFLTITIFNIWK